MPSSPTVATVKRLFAVAGNRCAFPQCMQALVHVDKVTGRICHISAASAGGPRYDAALSDAQRHGFDNLLLMCPIHHDVIDADPTAYTVARLLAMKADHEREATAVAEPDDAVVHQLIANLTNVRVEHGSVIITHNQSGGIAAHSVTITAPPARRLSPAQRQQFVAVLRGATPGTVDIECPLSSGTDALGFADDFRTALLAAGWRVDLPLQSTRYPVSIGVELVQRDRGPATASMQWLAAAFQAAGIGFTPLFDSEQSLPVDHLRICIGPPV